MNSNPVTEPASSSDRETNGRFAKNNPGGPGNPFARQTAALRAALINGVTERDIQDILDILLLNAKAGHLPTIKFLFAYVIGKPQPAVNPDALDVQEMQLFQQGAISAEKLEGLCRQLPLPFQLQLTHFSQAMNELHAAEEAQDALAAEEAPPPSSTETTPAVPPAAPSPNGENGPSRPAASEPAPSPNGENGRRPKRVGFDWLRELRPPSRRPPKT
jgi:hypothetical protein